MKISYGVVVRVPPQEAFTFVSEPENWPTFIPEMLSVHKDADWGRPGGKVTQTMKIAGRTSTSEFELTEWDPPHGFRYTARSSDLPDSDQRRAFSPTAGGTRFVGTSEMTPRRGLTGLFDRLSLLAIKRTMTKAMRRLPGAVQAHRAPH